jgi:hypothetical protein
MKIENTKKKSGDYRKNYTNISIHKQTRHNLFDLKTSKLNTYDLIINHLIEVHKQNMIKDFQKQLNIKEDNK